ncbi:Ntox16 domain-containing protein [Hyphomicrobiales bacterium]|nr:Ntox16 domain-containing protein [Hyphomicrobiales bacterium]CAH1702774.1 exported hypothetical protein [Hyphomicrobiales bacterium]CAI0346964.1 Ntox16 domain-containing protein [Hyphomicrobiales bacterium]
MLSAALLLTPIVAQAQTAVMPSPGALKLGVGVGGGVLAYKAAKACLDHKISCAVAIGGGAALVHKFNKDAGLPPPGDCGPEQYRRLNAEVNQACKSPPTTRCIRTNTRAALLDKADSFIACAIARSRRETTCFRGGDANHKKQIEQNNNAYRNCIEMAGQ